MTSEATQGFECPDGGDCAIEQAGGSQCSYACDRPTEDDLVRIRAAQVGTGEPVSVGDIPAIKSPDPDGPFDFYAPDEQVSYWIGPVGAYYPMGVTEARVFAEPAGPLTYLVGIELKVAGTWRRAHVESLSSHSGKAHHELAETRTQALWRYLWGLLRIAYVEVSLDDVAWVRAKTLECLSKGDKGEVWLIPIPMRKEEVPGAWKSLRLRALGIREGISLEVA